MPASAALSPDFLQLPEHESVENALASLGRAHVDVAAVIDSESRVVGLFSHHSLLRNVLPVSLGAPSAGGLDIKLGAAPGAAQRLRKVMPLAVSGFMDRRFAQMPPETSLAQALSLLLEVSGPVLVVEPLSQRPLGFITMASALKEMMRLQESAA